MDKSGEILAHSSVLGAPVPGQALHTALGIQTRPGLPGPDPGGGHRRCGVSEEACVKGRAELLRRGGPGGGQPGRPEGQGGALLSPRAGVETTQTSQTAAAEYTIAHPLSQGSGPAQSRPLPMSQEAAPEAEWKDIGGRLSLC